jgi:hypothetical protein
MTTIGTLIQALLLAGGVAYFIPYLWAGMKELFNEIREDNKE